MFASVFTEPPDDPDAIIYAASLILWTITAIVLCKYALIVLQADDNGQGKLLGRQLLSR